MNFTWNPVLTALCIAAVWLGFLQSPFIGIMMLILAALATVRVEVK